MTSFEFSLPGRARPQGSMRIVMIKGRPVIIPHNSATLKAWRRHVAWSAADAVKDKSIITGPCSVELIFYFAPPGKPKFDRPGVRPDIDKLVRAMLDSFTRVLFVDDGQVVDLEVHLYYAPVPLVTVRVAEV